MDALQQLTAAVEAAVERSVPLNLKAGGTEKGFVVGESRVTKTFVFGALFLRFLNPAK